MKNLLTYWLALSSAPAINPRQRYYLCQSFTDITELFCSSRNKLEEIGLKEVTINYLKQSHWPSVQKDLEWLSSQSNHYILTFNDTYYPPLLKEIEDPPLILYVRGNPELLSSFQLGIVGSRHASHTGKDISFQFAQALSQAGLTITSGLALGIDGAAHRGALSVNGTTVAVLGCGLDICYPTRHRELFEQISLKGTLVSEFVISQPPQAWNFPQRNRIISGLSLGTLVVEATTKSGSLITARFAAEQGRDVFAILGSIFNPQSQGCHALIRQGAKLVETIEDILEELPQFSRQITTFNDLRQLKPPLEQKNRLDEDCQKLLECIGNEPTPIDRLVERSGQSIQKVTSLLPVLELEGVIHCSVGGYLRSRC